MSKNNENKLVPKLRFPEFAKDEEWVFNKLGNVYSFITTNSYSRDDLNYKNGEVKNIHYGDIHTKFSTLFDITKENVPFINESIPLDKFKQENYCKERDIIFADASEDLKDVGKSIELVNLNNEKLLSGLHTLHARQIDNEIVLGFGGYLFLNENIRKQIQRESQGAKVLGISAIRLSNINIFYSKNSKEQQKIAACLSSLDDVITAESKKLEVLKEHKKGLLQNLFPQEGETVPKLRFKEFEDSGEWVERTLGEVSDNVMYGMNSAAIMFDGENKYIRITDIDDNTRLFSPNPLTSPDGQLDDKYFVNVGDILFARTGASVGKSYLHQKENGKIYFAGFLIRFTIKNANPYFIYLQTLTEKYQKWVSKTSLRSGQPGINAEEFKSYPILISSLPEQQRIASCLSSLDNLINAQSQKIETLKLHKKGLLQGLFPDINEHNG